jgi:hypothetical protein
MDALVLFSPLENPDCLHLSSSCKQAPLEALCHVDKFMCLCMWLEVPNIPVLTIHE